MTAYILSIQQKVKKISELIHNIESLFNSIKNSSQEPNLDLIDESRILQLLFRYRLSAEDALVSLMHLDKHLLYILGIEPHQSQKMNLDRMSYALGMDDLKAIMHALNKLLDYLVHIANRYQLQHQNRLDLKNKARKEPKLIESLQKLVTHQLVLTEELKRLEQELSLLIKYEALGPVLDHIAALRGPVSQFYQALQHGLMVTKTLYEQLNLQQHFITELNETLSKAHQVLTNMPSLLHPQPHYALGHFSEKNSDELEQRATYKRLRPFFN